MRANRIFSVSLACVVAAVAVCTAGRLAAASLDREGREFRTSGIKSSDQKKASSYFRQAYAYVQQGNCEMAIRYLEAGLDHNPSLSEAWTYLGHCQEKVGDIESAMKSYKIALVLGPANNYSEVRLRNIKADADRPVIVVLDFHAPNMPSFDAEVLSQFVRSAVVRSHAYKVVDKKNMDKVLAEQAFQQTGFLSPEYAVKVGKILNAHFILLGAYSRFEGSRLLSAQIVGVETSHIIASDSERILERGNTQASAENLVARLLRTVKDGNLHEGIDENQAEIKLDIHESEFPNLLDSLPRQKSSKRWLTFGGIVTAIFVAVVAL